MPRSQRKLPCRCTHGKGIHHARRVKIRNKTKLVSVCNFPGCKCRDYKPEE